MEGHVLRWTQHLLNFLAPREVFCAVTIPGFFQHETAAAPLKG